MTRIRSVDLLPEIFKTSTNKKFLSSTLDQLVQQPKLKQTDVGGAGGTGNTEEDNYCNLFLKMDDIVRVELDTITQKGGSGGDIFFLYLNTEFYRH